MGQQINIAIGAVLPFTQLDHFDNGQALADHLQETTDALRNEISHPTSPNTRRYAEELATA